MIIPAILEKYRTELEAEMKAVLSTRKSPLYDMMRYHLGWTDKKGVPVQNNTGKALRPALCLFSCEAAGGDYHKALPAAAALEFIHNFSLIHDDIQDNDRERRRRPTVWTIWGKPQAINAGTAMHILASIALTRLDKEGVSLEKLLRLSRRLDEISLNLIEGQYLDISFEKQFDISVADYLEMISQKTAALISGSMETGAFLGTDDESRVNSFRDAGKKLGLAFQIRDDILGIWGDHEETGKPVGGDIRRRKKSFPVVFALEHTAGNVKKELLEIYKNGLMDENNVNKILAIFDMTGARENAQKQVEIFTYEAGRALKNLTISETGQNEIKELVQFLSGRSF